MIKNPSTEQLRSLKMIIYSFTNNITGQKYIGKTINKFIDRYVGCRWWESPSNRYIKNSVEKYGLENFSLDILEYEVESREKLKELEINYIKELNTFYPNGYNYLKGGDEMVHTESSKRLISESLCKTFYFYDHKLNREIKILNLEKFCIENNLQSSLMYMVHLRQRKRHRYYTAIGIHLKKWQIVSKDGEEILILEGELNKFCRDRGLHKNGITELCNGKISYYRGYTKK